MHEGLIPLHVVIKKRGYGRALSCTWATIFRLWKTTEQDFSGKKYIIYIDKVYIVYFGKRYKVTSGKKNSAGFRKELRPRGPKI